MANHETKGNIGVTSENIFPVIKKFLYSDHEIFLRELVSNAIDATQKLKTLSSVGDFKGELGDLSVRIRIEDGKLIVSDRTSTRSRFPAPKSSCRSIRTMRLPSSDISDWDSIRRSWWPKRSRSLPNRIKTALWQ